MAKPMRRSFDGLGGEPWTRRTWCSDISPGRGVMIRRREWSTSPITSWPRQEIVFGEGVAVGDLIELVAAGDVLHCPVRLGRWCEGDPRCHNIGLTQAPIGRILMPRHEGRIGRLLDEEVGGPAQQIRAVEILDRVEDGA